MNNPPFFIIGVPRSGTTLLRDILARHSDIALPPEETQFLPDLMELASRPGDGNFSERASRIVEHSNFAFLMERRHAVPVSSLMTPMSAVGPFDVLRHVVYVSSRKHEAKTWGDKTPNYAWMVDRMIKQQPDARFVYIVRDPRDVALSMGQAWGKSATRAALDWNRTENLMASWKARGMFGAGNLCEVRYEDLLESPAEVIEGICAFIGVPFEMEMLELDSSSERWGAGTGHFGIKKNNVDKHLQSKHAAKVRVVEALCGRAMGDRGYKRVADPSSDDARVPGHLALRAIAACDSVRAMHRYVRDFGLVGGVRYKLRQRGVRLLRSTDR